MSVGNAGAAIGLANSNKQVPIGSLVADALDPTAGVNYAGVNMRTFWDRNWLGEDPAGPFTVSSCNAGKVATWVTSGAAPIVVSADSTMAVSGAGVATAAAAGAFKSFFAPGVTIPAGSFFWVES
jgi:hypothetical protein